MKELPKLGVKRRYVTIREILERMELRKHINPKEIYKFFSFYTIGWETVEKAWKRLLEGASEEEVREILKQRFWLTGIEDIIETMKRWKEILEGGVSEEEAEREIISLIEPRIRYFWNIQIPEELEKEVKEVIKKVLRGETEVHVLGELSFKVSRLVRDGKNFKEHIESLLGKYFDHEVWISVKPRELEVEIALEPSKKSEMEKNEKFWEKKEKYRGPFWDAIGGIRAKITKTKRGEKALVITLVQKGSDFLALPSRLRKQCKMWPFVALFYLILAAKELEVKYIGIVRDIFRSIGDFAKRPPPLYEEETLIKFLYEEGEEAEIEQIEIGIEYRVGDYRPAFRNEASLVSVEDLWKKLKERKLKKK